MIRALSVAVISAGVLVGCVGVIAPTAEPTVPVASFGITTPAIPTLSVPTAAPSLTVPPVPTLPPTPSPSPTLAATATPTEEPTATPTEAPTTAPTEAPSEAPTSAPTEIPSELEDLLIDDDMSDETSGWGTTDTGDTTVTFVDGKLRFEHALDTGAFYSGRQFDGTHRAALVAGQFVPASQGAMGVMCGTADGTSYGALVSTGDVLIFFSIAGGQIEVFDSYSDLGLGVTPGSTIVLSVGCALASDDTLRMIASVNNSGALATYHGSEPIDGFTSMLLYSEPSEAGYVLDVDGAVALGKGDEVEPSEEAAELLTHLPEDVQESCIEFPRHDVELRALVTCFMQPEGDGAEAANYQAFTDPAALETSYQGAVDRWAVESTGDCETGPNESSWTFNDVERGRLMCAPQTVGIRFDWSNTETNIMGTMLDFEGDYGLTYADWAEVAGTP